MALPRGGEQIHGFFRGLLRSVQRGERTNSPPPPPPPSGPTELSRRGEQVRGFFRGMMRSVLRGDRTKPSAPPPPPPPPQRRPTQTSSRRPPRNRPPSRNRPPPPPSLKSQQRPPNLVQRSPPQLSTLLQSKLLPSYIPRGGPAAQPPRERRLMRQAVKESPFRNRNKAIPRSAGPDAPTQKVPGGQPAQRGFNASRGRGNARRGTSERLPPIRSSGVPSSIDDARPAGQDVSADNVPEAAAQRGATARRRRGNHPRGSSNRPPLKKPSSVPSTSDDAKPAGQDASTDNATDAAAQKGASARRPRGNFVLGGSERSPPTKPSSVPSSNDDAMDGESVERMSGKPSPRGRKGYHHSVAAQEPEEAAIADGSQADPSTTLPTPIEEQTKPHDRVSCKDVLVIMVIWASGAVATLSAAVFNRSLDEKYSSDQVITIEESTSQLLSELFPTFIVVAPMILLAYIASVAPNHGFFLLQGGLYIVCLITPIVGIVSESRPANAAYAVAIYWLSRIWFMVHPLRFMFIFYQYLPMRATTSHRFVSVNVFLIGTTEFLAVLFVTGSQLSFTTVSSDEEEKRYFSLRHWWIAVLSAGSVVLLLSHIVTRWIKEIPSHRDDIRFAYEGSPAIYSFDRRQLGLNWIMATILILLGCSFTILKTALVFGMDDLRKNVMEDGDDDLFNWRIELISYLSTIVLVEFLFLVCGHISEMTNLIIIFLAYVLAVAALVHLVFLVLPSTEQARSYLLRPGNAIVHIITDPSIAGGEQVMWQIGINHITTEENGLLMRKIPHFDGEDDDDDDEPEQHLRARLFEANHGEVLIDDEIDVENSNVNLFQQVMNADASSDRGESHFKYSLQKVAIDSKTFKNMDVPQPRIFWLNALDDCNATGPFAEPTFAGQRNLATLLTCMPVEYVWDDGKTEKVSPPNKGDSSGPHTLTSCHEYENISQPCLKLEARVHSNLDELRDALHSATKISVEDLKSKVEFEEAWDVLPYTILYIRLEITKRNSLDLFNHLRAYEYSTHRQSSAFTLIPPLILLGIALGLSTVAYIHFMWIALPISNRVFMIYGFFVLDFFGRWMAQEWVQDFNEFAAMQLLKGTLMALAIHSIISFFYYARLTLLKFPEEKLYRKRRF